MPYKVVRYRLEANGTIPTWLKFGVPQGTGGMYAVVDSSTASPRDNIMIGIADDGADISDAVEHITSQSNLQTYLSTQASANNWTDRDANNNDVSFDAAAHAARVWNDLTTLNGD